MRDSEQLHSAESLVVERDCSRGAIHIYVGDDRVSIPVWSLYHCFESIHALPNFRKSSSVCENAGLGECIAVQLYGELLILADETGGDYIAREVHVFDVGTSVQNVRATGRI